MPDAPERKGKTMKPMTILVKTEVRRLMVRMSKLAFVVATGGLLATAYCAAASAQMITPFAGYTGPTLSRDDYRVATVAAGKLLNDKPVEIGRYEDWSNAASGNSGSFTILSIFTMNGMPCRRVKAHVVYSKASAPPRSFTLNACQIPSGQWKTVT
jgi:surface antigen